MKDEIFKKPKIEIVAVEFLLEADFAERIVEFDEVEADFPEVIS